MLEYRSTIKADLSLFRTEKAANLYLEGFSLDDIKQKALDENIFLLNSKQD